MTPPPLRAVVVGILFAAATCLAHTALAYTGDAPEISRSPGRVGGVVVLWPRIVPATEDPGLQELAVTLQQRLRAIAEKAKPGALIDVRPSPQRACPIEAGCKGVSIGVLLAHDQGGCAAVATVAPAGTAPSTLVPWAGSVKLLSFETPFRDAPEKRVSIADFSSCDDLATELEASTDAIVEAIRSSDD
jgi:hypothetical protein